MKTRCGRHKISFIKNELSVEQAIEDGDTLLEEYGVNPEDLEWKTDGS